MYQLQLTDEQSKETIKQAVQSKNQAFLPMLLHSASSVGIGINTPLDDRGNACLHVAAEIGATEMAKFLVENGADIAHVNFYGQTAEAVAKSHSQIELASWLRQLRKEKERGFYADKDTVETLQTALLQLQIENKQLKQNGQSLTAEIEKLQTELNEKIVAQEQQLAAQKEIIAAQQEEISNMQKIIKAMEEKQSSFMQEMLLSKRNKLREKAEINRQKEEGKYQALREKQKKEEQKLKEQLPKQAQLIKALLKGDLAEAKKQESQGALLTMPDADGTYPLVAAAYGLSIEAVNYIESRLQPHELDLQWATADIQQLIAAIDKAQPEELGQEAALENYADWHKDNAAYERTWGKAYDQQLLSRQKCDKWLKSDWRTREKLLREFIGLIQEKAKSFRGSVSGGTAGQRLQWQGLWKEIRTIMSFQGADWIVIKTNGTGGLAAPFIESHNYAVKEIREQLNALKKMVETRAGKQPGIAAKVNNM